MRIKKLNAWLALITVALLLIHETYQLFAFILFYYNPVMTKVLGYALALAFVLHGILSAYCLFVLHDSKTITYKKMNIKTVLQRISGLAMILLLPLHICSFLLLQRSAGTIIFYLILASQVLFYAAINCHVAVSFSSAFITLGYLEDMDKKDRIDRTAWFISTLLFITTSVVIISVYNRMFG